jgi:uncharacterized membrane protein YkvI
MQSSFFKKYLLPGFVFQSIVIGGGYGTGRELVEFFLSQGPLDGYLGMLLATLIWGVIIALGFELARMGRHYDYRTFLSGILGRGWIAFDVLYVLSVLLTVAVVGSASGELLYSLLGWPRLAGTLLMIAVVVLLLYWGSNLIEQAFSVWSFVLYAVYLVMIVLVLRDQSGTIFETAGLREPNSSWILAGLRYAAYNLAALPAMLFVVRHIETRREALSAGLLAGVIAMFPGALIYTAFLAHYPAIVKEPIPAAMVLGSLHWPSFEILFQIVLFGTFIETGTGMIHGFNERIAGAMEERGRAMTHVHRLGIACVVLVISVWLADRIGLIGLISKGYGLITWGYWIFFLLPVLLVGCWKIFRVPAARAR